MNRDKVMSAAEQAMMRMTFKATMLRAADILDKISESDVVDAQERLLAEGMSLEQVCKVDRALLGASHLRACANGEFKR